MNTLDGFSKRIKYILLILILYAGSYAFGAEIYIPSLYIITRGSVNDGSLALTTRAEMDIEILGGYKFGGNVVLSYQNAAFETYQEEDNLDPITDGDDDTIDDDRIDQIEQIIDDIIDYVGMIENDMVTFKTASIVIDEVFSLPISLRYFTGEMDTYCSGDGFSEFFGTPPFAAEYKGYLYFPEGTNFEGIHKSTGTGIKLSFYPGRDHHITSLYVYQDSYLGPGYYSGDLRTMINLEKLKFEFFAGASYPVSTYGIYRGGLLFYAYDEFESQKIEFMAQLGIPKWDPQLDILGMNLFYLLFEPRVRLGFFSIFATFFWHPQYYLQQITEELGSFDVNLNFKLGNIEQNLATGGLESNLAFNTKASDNADRITARIAPYFSFITSGIVWDFKLNMTVWPFTEVVEMFEGFVGLKAEF